MEDPGIERLKEHFRRHNRWVLLLAVLTAFISALIWAAVYFTVYWLVLLAGSIADVNYQPKPGEVLRSCAIATATLLAIAWAARRVRPNAAARDKKHFFEHLLDVLLALPRMTLSIVGTGSASARLNREELQHALDLLHRMDESRKPLPIQYLPVDIPNAKMRDRILLALQYSGIIEIRTNRETGPVLVFRSQEVRELAQDRVRLHV
jgi:hypothetical protein